MCNIKTVRIKTMIEFVPQVKVQVSLCLVHEWGVGWCSAHSNTGYWIYSHHNSGQGQSNTTSSEGKNIYSCSEQSNGNKR